MFSSHRSSRTRAASARCSDTHLSLAHPSKNPVHNHENSNVVSDPSLSIFRSPDSLQMLQTQNCTSDLRKTGSSAPSAAALAKQSHQKRRNKAKTSSGARKTLVLPLPRSIFLTKQSQIDLEHPFLTLLLRCPILRGWSGGGLCAAGRGQSLHRIEIERSMVSWH